MAETASSQAMPSNIATAFINRHTITVTHLDGSLHPECPICLDNYTSESCLRITGIPGCMHVIGKMCLEEMVRRSPGQEKNCPLCRATWIAARGSLRVDARAEGLVEMDACAGLMREIEHVHARARETGGSVDRI